MSCLIETLPWLYGVETKRVNEAVKNNPEKFPKSHVLELDEKESFF